LIINCTVRATVHCKSGNWSVCRKQRILLAAGDLPKADLCAGHVGTKDEVSCLGASWGPAGSRPVTSSPASAAVRIQAPPRSMHGALGSERADARLALPRGRAVAPERRRRHRPRPVPAPGPALAAPVRAVRERRQAGQPAHAAAAVLVVARPVAAGPARAAAPAPARQRAVRAHAGLAVADEQAQHLQLAAELHHRGACPPCVRPVRCAGG